MDLLKHGESAYPADAWVEQQYMSENAVLTVSSQNTFSFAGKMFVTFCNKKVHKESTKCFVLMADVRFDQIAFTFDRVRYLIFLNLRRTVS